MPVTANTSTANRQIARAAGTVMIAFVLSNLAGLLRQVLVAQTFGTNQEVGAFYLVANLPDMLFNLLAGGALASAFIPTFGHTPGVTRALKRRDGSYARSVRDFLKA